MNVKNNKNFLIKIMRFAGFLRVQIHSWNANVSWPCSPLQGKICFINYIFLIQGIGLPICSFDIQQCEK